MESKPKNVGLKKAYFWGHPLIQTVEAKKLGYFQNISSLKIFPLIGGEGGQKARVLATYICVHIMHIYFLIGIIFLFNGYIHTTEIQKIYTIKLY